MKRAELTILGFLAALGMAVACSKAPKQYNPAAPPASVHVALSASTEIASAANTRQWVGDGDTVRENAKKPIIYGEGAAGVTFSMPFSAGKKILSSGEDVSGPFESQDHASWFFSYPEEVSVYWRKDEPRTASAIHVLYGYQGPWVIDGRENSPLPGELRTLHLGDNLGKWLDADPSGAKLVNLLYVGLEQKDADFDCIKENICSVNRSESGDIDLGLPYADLIIAYGTRTLTEIDLSSPTPDLGLNGDFDLLSGRFSGSPLGIGSTVADLGALQPAVKANYIVKPATFTQEYQGVNVELTKKSSDDKSYVVPTPTEKVWKIDLFNNLGTGVFKLGSNFVKIDPSKEEMLELTPKMDPESSYLRRYPVVDKKTFPLFKAKLPTLMRQLVQLIARESTKQAQLQGLSAPQQLISDSDGAFDKSEDRTLRGSVINYYAKTAKAPESAFKISVAFSISDGGVGVAVGTFDNPLELHAIRAAIDSVQNPVVLKLNDDQVETARLAGFGLGDQVELRRVDVARREATLAYKIDGAAEATELRVKYDERAIRPFPKSTSDLSVRIMPRVYFTNLDGVALGLDGGGEGPHTVIDVLTSILGVRAKGFCGTSVVETIGGDARAGSGFKNEVDVSGALNRVFKRSDDQSACYWRGDDPNGSSHPLLTVFPNEKAMVVFDEYELSAIEIFSGGL